LETNVSGNGEPDAPADDPGLALGGIGLELADAVGEGDAVTGDGDVAGPGPGLLMRSAAPTSTTTTAAIPTDARTS
jgi:hypothetical protein